MLSSFINFILIILFIKKFYLLKTHVINIFNIISKICYY